MSGSSLNTLIFGVTTPYAMVLVDGMVPSEGISPASVVQAMQQSNLVSRECRTCAREKTACSAESPLTPSLGLHHTQLTQNVAGGLVEVDGDSTNPDGRLINTCHAIRVRNYTVDHTFGYRYSTELESHTQATHSHAAPH